MKESTIQFSSVSKFIKFMIIRGEDRESIIRKVVSKFRLDHETIAIMYDNIKDGIMESIILKEDLKIEGTDIILEKGDKILIQEFSYWEIAKNYESIILRSNLKQAINELNNITGGSPKTWAGIPDSEAKKYIKQFQKIMNKYDMLLY
jgi:hypothetical protein